MVTNVTMGVLQDTDPHQEEKKHTVTKDSISPDIMIFANIIFFFAGVSNEG